MDENQTAHLQMIQSVIARMANSSLAIKTLTVTLTSAIIALVAAQPEPKFELLIAGVLPVSIFWLLDAKFLRLERCFRNLFDAVRCDKVLEDPFLMDTKPFQNGVPDLFSTAFSWSVVWFYLISLVALTGSYLIQTGVL